MCSDDRVPSNQVSLVDEQGRKGFKKRKEKKRKEKKKKRNLMFPTVLVVHRLPYLVTCSTCPELPTCHPRDLLRALWTCVSSSMDAAASSMSSSQPLAPLLPPNVANIVEGEAKYVIDIAVPALRCLGEWDQECEEGEGERKRIACEGGPRCTEL